ALVLAPLAPGKHEEPPRAAHHTTHQIAAFDAGGMIGNALLGIEHAIQQQRQREDERNGQESGEQVLQENNILAHARLAVQENSQSQREEEHQAEEDQHAVQIERRIDLAEIGKEQRTDEEDGHLPEQAAAKDEFRGGGGKAADRALIAEALGATIQ